MLHHAQLVLFIYIKLYIVYIYQLNYSPRQWSTHIKCFLPPLKRVKLFWSCRHSPCMLSGLVSNVITTSLLKSALSESCSKFSSKAHPQAATQPQLSGAFLRSVAGYSTAPSGGDKGQLSCRAQQGKAEFRAKADREECVLVISLIFGVLMVSVVEHTKWIPCETNRGKGGAPSVFFSTEKCWS